MAITYIPIATTTLSSATSSIDFTNIPQTYTDLILVLNVMNVTTGAYGIRFNGDLGLNYSRGTIQGSGSGAPIFSTNTNLDWAFISDYGRPDNTKPALMYSEIGLYANSTRFKNVLSRASAGANTGLDYVINTWRNTAAINRITIINGSSNNMAVGTKATLYGILGA